MSAITPKSLDLVQIVSNLGVMHRSNGAAMPLDELPGHLVDAVRVCEEESAVIDAAMEDALN